VIGIGKYSKNIVVSSSIEKREATAVQKKLAICKAPMIAAKPALPVIVGLCVYI
jgi:hypothetical protein